MTSPSGDIHVLQTKLAEVESKLRNEQETKLKQEEQMNKVLEMKDAEKTQLQEAFNDEQAKRLQQEKNFIKIHYQYTQQKYVMGGYLSSMDICLSEWECSSNMLESWPPKLYSLSMRWPSAEI